MPNPSPKTEHLQKFAHTAKDTKGGTKQVQGRIEPQLKDWLKALPWKESVSVRAALRIYRTLIEAGMEFPDGIADEQSLEKVKAALGLEDPAR